MSEDSPIIADYKQRNHLHSLFMLFVMALLLASIGWMVAREQGVAMITLVASLLYISYPKFSAQQLLKAIAAEKLSEAQQPELLAKLYRLSAAAGLKNAPQMYRMPQQGISSFTLQLGSQSAIVISDSLINKLDQNETLAVLAHEVAHIYHDDIHVLQLAQRLSHFTQSLSAIGLIIMAMAPILMHDVSVPWLFIISLLMAHYMTALLQLSLSRSREFCADVIAVQLTHDVNAMVSALKKIEQQRHWFHDVFRLGGNSTVPALLRSHPSTQARIRCLLGLDMLSRFGRG